MAYEFTGTVKLVMDEVTFASGFRKREFVVTDDDDTYPQNVKFECVKGKTAQLDAVVPGQRVTVKFDLRGNEYKGRYYVNLVAWNVDVDEADAGGFAEPAPVPAPEPPAQTPAMQAPVEAKDDLPF